MTDPHHFENEHEIFKWLFETYKTPLHDYIQSITKSHEVAEDITQEIFIRLWKKRNELTQIENIDYYIYRMARNESMDFFNKVALDARLSSELKKRMSSSFNNVSTQMDSKEMSRLVQKGLSTLSPQRKLVYQLSRNQGLKLEEIARQLNLSVNTVKNHLIAALQQLREYLLQFSDGNGFVILFILSLNSILNAAICN
ncbi:MAG: RNA polymerase sigma-70 factor [Chitinophagaceae bacterium]|nr:RNA polymerase sigma-70 factor [Chitinophagaceae bacterium]